MVLALVSLVCSPLLIVNVVAMVFGALGISQSRNLDGRGRSRAIGAVVIATFGLACVLVGAIVLLSVISAHNN